MQVDWDSGTEILVNHLKPVVDFRAMNYTRTYAKKIGQGISVYAGEHDVQEQQVGFV